MPPVGIDRPNLNVCGIITTDETGAHLARLEPIGCGGRHRRREDTEELHLGVRRHVTNSDGTT